jgi:hypothetical protein
MTSMKIMIYFYACYLFKSKEKKRNRSMTFSKGLLYEMSAVLSPCLLYYDNSSRVSYATPLKSDSSSHIRQRKLQILNHRDSQSGPKEMGSHYE